MLIVGFTQRGPPRKAAPILRLLPRANTHGRCGGAPRLKGPFRLLEPLFLNPTHRLGLIVRRALD
jgi:hypothetical protein